jgi:hypothetical protein
MSIQLTPEQADGLAAEMDHPVAVIDPRTRQTYRLVPEAEYASLTGRPYDDSPWTAAETAALAAESFGKLDDPDYSDCPRPTR